MRGSQNTHHGTQFVKDILDIMGVGARTEFKELDKYTAATTNALPVVKNGDIGHIPQINFNQKNWKDVREAYLSNQFNTVLLHESIHAIQEEEIISAEKGEKEIYASDRSKLRFMVEGQSTALAGSEYRNYDDAGEIYIDMINKINAGKTSNEALKEINEEKYLAHVEILLEEDTAKSYMVAVDRERADNLKNEEIYERFVDSEGSKSPLGYEFHEIYLSENADAFGDLLIRVHNRVSEAYRRAFDRKNETVLDILDGSLLGSWLPSNNRLIHG